MANNHHPKKMPTGGGNPTAGEANNDLDCPTGQRVDKDFSTLRAAFALQGHALHRSDPADGPVTFWAVRCGLARLLPTLDHARRFLVLIGGRV
jgi:hypothetical protein